MDPASLPADTLITAELVRSLIKAPGVEGRPTGPLPLDPSAILVYGAGGHGKSVIDLLRALNTHRIVGVIDDGITPGEQVMGLPGLGGHESLAGLRESGVGYSINAVGGIGNIAMRIQVFQYLLGRGFECLTIVHPAALVEPSAVLADGVQVFPHAYIGSEAQVGFGCIVNTGAVVSHDCALGDYSNISPGAMLAGGVWVGEGVLIGMGATVNLNVSIGDGARIGNSAVVKSDVPGGAVVKAGTIWPA
jgi:sugar O-acyltransferase (sialic acid O-acetyltransferase NeuD family)